jgi:hypothetical protein
MGEQELPHRPVVAEDVPFLDLGDRTLSLSCGAIRDGRGCRGQLCHRTLLRGEHAIARVIWL